MIYKTTEEVIKLIKAFEGRTLSKTEWTHPAHLTVGLYYCLRSPFGNAVNSIRNGIRRLNEVHNNNNYHETLTVFWMIAIKQFAETSKSHNLAELANDLIDVYNDSTLPFRYYSREFLSSPAARKQHLPPDLDRFYLFVNSAELLSRANGGASVKFL